MSRASTRSGKRQRTTREQWTRFLRGYAVVVAASWILLVFLGPGTTSDTQPDADAPSPTTTTPYLREVGAHLAADHLYVDPLLAAAAPPDLVSGALHDDLTSASPAIYAAVIPTDDDDGSGGDGELTAERLHTVVGQDGIYVVAPQDGHCWAVRYNAGEARSSYCFDLSAASFSSMREHGQSDHGVGTAVRVLYPVMIGLGACVLIGWALSGIAWLRRRDVAFLRVR